MKPLVLYLALGFILLVLLFVSVELFFGGVGAILARFGWTTIRSLREERGLADSLRERGEMFRQELANHEAVEAAKAEAERLSLERAYAAINRTVEEETDAAIRSSVLDGLDEAGK